VAEGARLESVYRGNLIEGSNPSLSASFPLVVVVVPRIPNMTELLALHDAHHERLHEHVLTVLEALVDGEMALARAVLEQLNEELVAGLQLEDDVILPLYRTLPLTSPQGRADHVDGDHVILRRTLGAIAAWFDELGESPRRRRILAGLPVVYRLLHTLEHHHERERLHVYPAVDAVLDDVARANATTRLRRLVATTSTP
jgi:hypothetical protein